MGRGRFQCWVSGSGLVLPRSLERLSGCCSRAPRFCSTRPRVEACTSLPRLRRCCHRGRVRGPPPGSLVKAGSVLEPRARGAQPGIVCCSHGMALPPRGCWPLGPATRFCSPPRPLLPLGAPQAGQAHPQPQLRRPTRASVICKTLSPCHSWCALSRVQAPPAGVGTMCPRVGATAETRACHTCTRQVSPVLGACLRFVPGGHHWAGEWRCRVPLAWVPFKVPSRLYAVGRLSCSHPQAQRRLRTRP